MSLPQDWSLQDSRGSLYCPSEPDPTCRIEYKSGGLVRTPTAIPIVDAATIGSQPPPPSLLTECIEQSGSLFSIHSAPPVPLADLGIVQNDNLLGFGCTGTGPNITAAIDGNSPRRPASLAIDTPCCPARTLHSSLLQHQPSEIEEDDNENLLTVSSLTARPLIAKSREIRSNRLAEKNRKHGTQSNINNNNGGGGSSSGQSSALADPPDGGYGWFIVFGAFSVQFWVAGLVKSYGVLYVEIMENFPSTSATVASWIPAILSALCLALAPLSSALCQRFSCRTVVFIGGLFCAFGLTLSYFATSLLHLLFTFGILTGIGGGLSTTPGIVIVSQYFDKHRALANGICVSGTAAGSFILPVLIEHLVHHFGFHGTILILGGCMLHVCVSATLYRPLEQQQQLLQHQLQQKELKDDQQQHHQQQQQKQLLQSSSTQATLNGVALNNGGGGCPLTNSTYLDSCEEPLDRKFIEHLFLEESKNRINDYYNTNKFVNVNEKSIQDSDDECKDIVGETTFMKPIKSVRSSSILHSVEDLSTDSTCVYRKRSSIYDSHHRGSSRRKKISSHDEILGKSQQHQGGIGIGGGGGVGNAVINYIDKERQYQQQQQHRGSIANSNKGLSKSMIIPTPVSDLIETQHDEEFYDDDDDDEPETCCDRIQEYLDLSLLKDSTFILMCLSVTLMSVGCPYMLYYLPAHVISIGYSKSEAGYLVAVSAALDLIGRLGLGWLSDLQLFDRKKTYIVCILGAGTAVLTIPTARSFYIIGCAAGTYGLCLGCWYLLMPVLLADIFGTDRISSSYGLVRMFQSVGAISVPPLAGFLRDLSGNYEICFYCMGTCMVLGSIPLLVWAIMKYRQKLKRISKKDYCEDNSSVS